MGIRFMGMTLELIPINDPRRELPQFRAWRRLDWGTICLIQPTSRFVLPPPSSSALDMPGVWRGGQYVAAGEDYSLKRRRDRPYGRSWHRLCYCGPEAWETDSEMTGNEFEKISELVVPLGSVSFTRKFYNVCRDLFRNDQCTVFVLEEDQKPDCILSAASGREMRELTRHCANDYVDSGYRNDPTLAWMRSRRNTQFRPSIRSLSPREIPNADYRRRFYENAAVRQKLAAAQFSGGKLYYLNFYRNPDQEDYTSKDRTMLEGVSGLLCALIAKHHTMVEPSTMPLRPIKEMPDDFRSDLKDRVRCALFKEGVGLTPKEADICAAIALGQTAAGIGLEHGISVNTVATHRKRAYAKLGIGSQNELFARYYESITDQIRGHHLV
jgi:DNA-binding CsgD family transcriptional regulator